MTTPKELWEQLDPVYRKRLCEDGRGDLPEGLQDLALKMNVGLVQNAITGRFMLPEEFRAFLDANCPAPD
jgi:hypothetical protein